MTLNKTTHSTKMTLSYIATFSLRVLSISTFSIRTLSITTLSIRTLNITALSITTLCTECRFAEHCNAEFRGLQTNIIKLEDMLSFFYA